MAIVRKRTWTTKDGKERKAWLVDYRDQAGKRRFQTFKLERDAKAWLVTAQGEIARGTHTPVSTSITVAEAADIWMERGKAEGLERSTLGNYLSHVDLHIKPSRIGNEKLARLSTPKIEAFRDDLLKKGCSRGLAGKVLTSLKSIISEMQRRALVAQNAALPVKVGARKRDKVKIEAGVNIPTKEQVGRLLAAVKGRHRPLIVTAVFTGMRASELRGLPWSAVDFKKRTITVRQRADEWGTIGMPKSAAGQREIPMSGMVLNTLKEWKLACPKGELDLVFPNTLGKVQPLSNIAHRAWRPLQREVGLVDAAGEPLFNFHTLRHFAASLWIELGFTPKRLQALLGHSSITMTYDRYGHLFPSLEDDHAKLDAGEQAILRSL